MVTTYNQFAFSYRQSDRPSETVINFSFEEKSISINIDSIINAKVKKKYKNQPN